MVRLTVLLLVISHNVVSAQVPDAVNQNTGNPDTLPRVHVSDQDEWLPIYNGRFFYGYPFITKGDAFYPDKGWHRGTVVYDGVSYYGIDTRYDAYKDEIMVRNTGNISVILFSERVSAVSFDGYRFLYLEKNKEENIENGFYQQLLTGRISVLVKRSRLYEEAPAKYETKLERKFLVTDKYYLLKEGKYHPVSSKRKLFALLRDKEGKLDARVRELKLKYKKEPDRFIKEVVSYYNQLTG